MEDVEEQAQSTPARELGHFDYARFATPKPLGDIPLPSYLANKRATIMTTEQALVTAAVGSWKSTIERADRLFSPLTEEQLQKEVAPGKNRLIYLWGHLTAVHDRMLPLLNLGQRLHAELDPAFISNPDRTLDLPASGEIKKAWNEVNEKLITGFESLSAAEWLQKHASVSEEDFAKDPSRNRFAILLSRTNHLSFHLGQTVLIPK